jgi:heterotetrameric sarcosine oxidase gamma subunit
MASPVLTPRSGLEHLLVANDDSAAGVTLAVRSGLALVSVNVHRNQLEGLESRVHQIFGLNLPDVPKRVAAGPIGFLWAGAGQWLAMAEREGGAAFERRLRSALGNLASVTDQSDGRTIIRVAGPRAREVLAKGVQIDLHPRVFRPGDAAATTVAYIGVHFWQVDDAPTYEFLVPRSFAMAFWGWLTESAAVFGVQVATEGGAA